MTWTDEKAGLRVVIGFDMQEYCAGGADVAAVSVQKVLVPDGRQIWQQHVTEYTTVWPFVSFDCDLFTSTPALATGYADLVYTYNDVFLTGESNANAHGWMAHGMLVRASGDDAVFSGHYRLGSATSQRIMLR